MLFATYRVRHNETWPQTESIGHTGAASHTKRAWRLAWRPHGTTPRYPRAASWPRDSLCAALAQGKASKKIAPKLDRSMFEPTLRDLETIADMARMPPGRIAAALGISLEVFTAWVSRLATAAAMDPADADKLMYPPTPRPHRPSPAPRHDPRVIAERMFAAAE